jgi:hypothetical protein
MFTSPIKIFCCIKAGGNFGCSSSAQLQQILEFNENPSCLGELGTSVDRKKVVMELIRWLHLNSDIDLHSECLYETIYTYCFIYIGR